MVERKQSFLESVRDAGGSSFQARAAKKYFQNWLSSRPPIPKFNQVNCNESNLTIGDHFFIIFVRLAIPTFAIDRFSIFFFPSLRSSAKDSRIKLGGGARI